MAEAAVEMSAARFFCHRCVQEVNPILPDYVCPRCQSGFIEELEQQPAQNTSGGSSENFPLSRIPDLRSLVNIFQRGESNNATQGGQEENGLPRPGPGSSRRNFRIGGASRRQANESEAFRNETEMFLQQLFINLLTENAGFTANNTFPVFLNLHSNPRDYVWGRGGWNAIITQLINQLDGTGPPPLPKEKIDEIPTVQITQEQVDKVLQCTVCMEDYRVGEEVRRLPCEHHFHNECIIPWLELHGTCPICRKILMDDSFQESSPFTSQANSVNTPNQQSPGPSTVRTDVHRPSNATQAPTYRPRSPPHYPSVFDFTDEYD